MEPAIRTREWRGWTVHEADCLGSTNDHARNLAPWQVVRALRQTGARGRHGRKWSSGEGGLWMSVVLPLEPAGAGWHAFPLVAGLAVVTTLRGLGLTAARLRWPNDVLIGPRKICGILMEKFHADRVVVGLGLNVTNDPASDDPALAAIATSLARELPEAPDSGEIFAALLTALRVLHTRVAEDGFGSLVDEINHHWGGTREVELHLAETTERGLFQGIDNRGDLLLETDGRLRAHDAAYVRLMREV